MLDYSRLRFRYEPFPLGVAERILDPGLYRDLVRAFPPRELFVHEPALGNRYSLSRHNNRKMFERYIAASPVWRELDRWVRSDDFLVKTLDALQSHCIRLGRTAADFRPPARLRVFLRGVRRGMWLRGSCGLRGALVFCRLPAAAGSLLPHTDNPDKLLNLSVSMTDEGEWHPSFGGGTDVNRPRDVRRTFNRRNERLGFDEVDVLDTIPFRSNQGLLVVKTFNSLHSVCPIRGSAGGPCRQSVNINLLGRIP